MDTKILYDFLFQLFDYANYLFEQVSPNNNPDNENYFISLIYIEDMMDKYGRGIISKAAHELNPKDAQSLEVAHRQIDDLRKKINTLWSRHRKVTLKMISQRTIIINNIGARFTARLSLFRQSCSG